MTQWHPAASVFECYWFFGWLPLWTEPVVQSTEVWKGAIAECFRSCLLVFFFFQPAVCGFLWKVFRKFVVSRFEFIVQTLNLHWRNVCLTSFDCSGFVPCGGRMEEEAVGRQVGVRDPFCFPLAVRCFYWILHLLRLFPLGRSHANTQSWTLWAERLGFLSGSLKCTNCFALSLPLMS